MSKKPEIKSMQACQELDGLINTQVHATGTPEIIEIQNTFWRFVEDLRQRDLAFAHLPAQGATLYVIERATGQPVQVITYTNEGGFNKGWVTVQPDSRVLKSGEWYVPAQGEEVEEMLYDIYSALPVTIQDPAVKQLFIYLESKGYMLVKPSTTPLAASGGERETTKHFKEWLDRFFDQEIKVLHYKSKHNCHRAAIEDLYQNYERAMLESPFLTPSTEDK